MLEIFHIHAKLVDDISGGALQFKNEFNFGKKGELNGRDWRVGECRSTFCVFLDAIGTNRRSRSTHRGSPYQSTHSQNLQVEPH